MIKQIFNRNRSLQIIILVIASILVWLQAFLTTPLPETSIALSPFYNIIRDSIITWHPLIAVIIAWLLHLVFALFFAWVLTSFELISRSSFLPAAFLVILTAWDSSLQTLNPVIFSSYFILISLIYLLNMYGKSGNYSDVFSVGFSISVASLFYYPSLIFALLIFISFLIYRTLNWRTWLIAMAGIIFPYFYLFFYYFMTDQFFLQLQEYNSLMFSISLPGYNISIYKLVFWGLFLLLTLASIVHLLYVLSEKVIRFRKLSLIITWLGILSVFSFIKTDISLVSHTFLLFIPASFFLSRFLQTVKWKKNFWPDLYFVLLILALLASRFLPIIKA